MNNPSPSPAFTAGNANMRLAVVCETWPPEINGVAMTMERMVRELVRRGHQVSLLRPRQGPQDRPVHGDRYQEHLFPGLRIPRYDQLRVGLPARAALQRMWQEQRPDLVHVATEGPLGLSAVTAANRLNLPVVTDFHTNFHTYTRHYGLGLLARPMAAYLRGMHNRSRCTLVPTHALRDELTNFGYRNVLVVSRGVDSELFHPDRRSSRLRQAWGAARNTLVALYVGRLAPEKGLLTVLRAHQAMVGTHADTRLVFVGDGPERGRLQRAHPEHIWAGMRSGVDLAEHYASADAFLFASTTETYGNVTMEAMASGLPVLAYDYAAAREHVRHEHNGLVAPFDNESAFIAQARRLAADCGLRQALAKAARSTARTVDWSHIHDSFEHILQQVARTGGVRNSPADLTLAPERP